MARGEFSTPPSLLSKLGPMAGPPSPPVLGLWRVWSQAWAQHAEQMAWVKFPPLRRCCLDRIEWPGPFLFFYSGFGGLGSKLDLFRQERDAELLVGEISHREIPRATDPRNTQRMDMGQVGVAVEPVRRPGAAIVVAVGGGLAV